MIERTGCFSLLLIMILVGCRKGEKSANQAPDTKISISEINLSGDDRLISTVTLSWFGTDTDGYINGYEISVNGSEWDYTTAVDSTFSFDIPIGEDTTDIDFAVRAVDNDSEADPSPATLTVPIRNTPPTASFNDPLGPKDTAFVVATFNWKAGDPDGDNSVTKVEVQFNDGQWFEINREQAIISFLVDTAVQSGNATAEVYYGSNTTAQGSIDGIRPNAENELYIRATDIAGEFSIVDTAQTFFLKNKTPGANLLWISGQDQSITDAYKDVMNTLPLKYDLLNYGRGQIQDDGEGMPKYWDPSVRLITTLYDKMFVNSGQETFPLTMLEFLAPIIQEFTNEGGRSFITSSFNKNQNLKLLRGPYPIEELVAPEKGNSPSLSRDSVISPLISGTYPNLQPTKFLLDVVPFESSADSEPFYKMHLTPPTTVPWTMSKTAAAIRRPNNQWSQVFFAVELHKFDSDQTKLEDLFEEILVNEF